MTRGVAGITSLQKYRRNILILRLKFIFVTRALESGSTVHGIHRETSSLVPVSTELIVHLMIGQVAINRYKLGKEENVDLSCDDSYR